MRIGLALFTLGSCATLAVACNDKDSSAQTSASGSETSTTSTSTSSESTAEGSTGDPTIGTTGLEGECSIWAQDCPEGDKCMPWSDEPDLYPDELRCCPEVANAGQVGDDCVVEDYFGACLDDCVKGTLCLDTDNDGIGQCHAFCSGSPQNPICEPDEKCFIYFAGIPLCFQKCDPLIQDCQGEWGCYPDEEAAGGTDWVCLPQIAPSTLGGYCWLLSNCEPGLICVTPEFLPDCNGLVGCCTSLCDTSEADSCSAIHPDLVCVSWYSQGGEPPEPYLQDVGACILPG